MSYPHPQPFAEGTQFKMNGKVWTVDTYDCSVSDGTWYCLNAPDEDDIEILSHEQCAALERA